MPRFASALGFLLAALAIPASAQAPTIVRSANAPVWGTAPRLVPELRIGVVDGDEEYMFAGVVGVAIGTSGRIIVADGGAVPTVRVYDATGKFLRNIGRTGDGPGEFRRLSGVRTFADGRIALWDARSQRLTTFTPDGRPIASVRVPQPINSDNLFHVNRATGESYVKTVTRLDPLTKEFDIGWTHVSPDLRILETAPIPRRATSGYVLTSPSGFDRAFLAESVLTITSRGETLWGANTNYAFELRRKNAPTVRIERPYTPVRVEAAERNEWNAWTAYFSAGENRGNAQTMARARTFVLPTIKPAYRDLISDSDGRIWVHRYVPAVSRPAGSRPKREKQPIRTWREPSTFDVFEPSGRFLGTVTLPWDARFADAIGMKVYVVQTGPDGDESVQRLRIEPAR